MEPVPTLPPDLGTVLIFPAYDSVVNKCVHITIMKIGSFINRPDLISMTIIFPYCVKYGIARMYTDLKLYCHSSVANAFSNRNAKS